MVAFRGKGIVPSSSAEPDNILMDLGDGLVLRHAASTDVEALADFQAVFNSVLGRPDESIRAWTHDLMSGGLRDFEARDFTVVEDTKTGTIVSSLNLISQTWSYAGINFPVGRIELVATHPDYRRNGLVRSQMNVVQGWSAERRELVLGITGIPWFYRQFGYEMALECFGGRLGAIIDTPVRCEEYKFRPATREDLPMLVEMYDRAMQRYLVSCVRDEAMWEYEIYGRSQQAAHRSEILVIERLDDSSVGYLIHEGVVLTDAKAVNVTGYELAEGVSWSEVTPVVMRYMQGTVNGICSGMIERTNFSLGTHHPAYDLAKDFFPNSARPYAWYLRVPDMVNFLKHIGSVLEHRIAGSCLSGYTGDIKISFVTDGVRIFFRSGRLVEVIQWFPTQDDSRLAPKVRDALYPGNTFLPLLFGFKSIDDLESAFPDCLVSSAEARQLLSILFPKKASWVWGVE